MIYKNIVFKKVRDSVFLLRDGKIVARRNVQDKKGLKELTNMARALGKKLSLRNWKAIDNNKIVVQILNQDKVSAWFKK
ncbi:hypothetical protein HNQ94_000424 [Salirhabdus euzebyi]|uniref:Uncharacterized protein n=1 Tax=Salirhabdus euzebyi TaxID=394506 RepID=A0A841Q1E6_9BACI|nr:hypothetical protein [Salirhabdus euzebyi]MBB6452003.1 hypothetical protein [Salirhabdus euzebyi]